MFHCWWSLYITCSASFFEKRPQRRRLRNAHIPYNTWNYNWQLWNTCASDQTPSHSVAVSPTTKKTSNKYVTGATTTTAKPGCVWSMDYLHINTNWVGTIMGFLTIMNWEGDQCLSIHAKRAGRSFPSNDLQGDWSKRSLGDKIIATRTNRRALSTWRIQPFLFAYNLLNKH